MPPFIRAPVSGSGETLKSGFQKTALMRKPPFALCSRLYFF